MRMWKTGAAVALAAGVCLLSGCGSVVDESVLNTQADYSVSINVPYATATPLPEHLNVPDAVVIDAEGNVSVNDATAIEGDFQSQHAQQAEYQSLTLGTTGTEVQALQARLQALGYFEGDVSGVYDATTEEAIKRFERTYGTMQTGVATSKLQLKLFAAGAPAYGSEEYENAVVAQYSVLRAGNVGSSVYALQQRLKELGYPVGELNGVFDAQTANCVAMFYNAYGLAANPVASVSMQQMLYADDAVPYDPSMASVTPAPASDPALQTLEGGGSLPDDMLEDGFTGAADTAQGSDVAGYLVPGSGAEVVADLQSRLIELGYLDEVAASGIYDAATQEAADRFLLMNGQASDGGTLSKSQLELLLGETLPEATPVPTQVDGLNYGDSGAGVLTLQSRLIDLGYAAGTADGKYGRSTIAAVRAFQQINDLNADGKATEETLSVLYSEAAVSYEDGQEKLERILAEATPVPEADDEAGSIYYSLSSGAAGNAVKKLQQRLNKLGYLSKGKISGSYDDATISAVASYQKAIGLPQTGEASASFQRYIYSKAAPGKGYRLHTGTQEYEALDVGSFGDEVTNLQERLVKCGMMKSDDVEESGGVFDEATREAVAKAQKKMGYDVCDGDASIEFQAFLYSKYGTYLKWK